MLLITTFYNLSRTHCFFPDALCQWKCFSSLISHYIKLSGVFSSSALWPFLRFSFFFPRPSIRKSVSSTFSIHAEAGHPQHLHCYCSALIVGSSLRLFQDHFTLTILPLVLCNLSAAKQPVILLKYRRDYVFPVLSSLLWFPTLLWMKAIIVTVTE